MKPTSVSLQLADRSIKYPRGIIEDVLVRVDKLILPADFLVLDMEEDEEIPIILGRPFLATGSTLIDVKHGLLTLRVQDEQVVFKVFEATKYPSEKENCLQAETVQEVVSEKFKEECSNDAISKKRLLQLNGMEEFQHVSMKSKLPLTEPGRLTL